ncbi:MAG: pyridoxamine 5'-phosphate oxidase [Planctomycetota bacterium]
MSFDTDDLPQLLEHLWDHLDAATRSAKPPFHLPTFCTINSDEKLGPVPTARTVVLRRVDREHRRVICHTDRRAGKIDELQTHPVASWLFYDGPAKLQLRVTGRVSIHHDDELADQQWAESALTSRRCYLAPHPPGQAADHPSPNLPEALRDRPPTEAESAAGRSNFAVLACVADRFEMLHLKHSGHRRAAFVWNAENAPPQMSWLEP